MELLSTDKMKYTPKLPDDSVNVSSEHPLNTALKLTFSLALFAGIAYILMGFIINYAVDSITPEQEKKLEKLLSSDLNISDSDHPYLVKVTKKLTQCAHLPYDIHIKIMQEDALNAFAAPGGIIYITKGMAQKVASENELAFIIGHELGHFKHKDHLRMLGYKLIFSMVGMFLGSDYGAAASTTLNIGSAKYSQSAELEADAYGLEVMHCAYGNVTDATKMFEKMDDGEEWKYFTATHPGFEKRILQMKDKIRKENMNNTQKVIPLEKISL
jgi:Zn-dependent protease with chaperone function